MSMQEEVRSVVPRTVTRKQTKQRKQQREKGVAPPVRLVHLAHGLGEASERARGSPTCSYRLHKWCKRSSPFKSVEILLKSRYGIKQLIP
jgi:hypothetical protein